MNQTARKMGAGFRVVLWTMVPAAAFMVLFAVGRPLWLDDTHSTFHAFSGPGGVVDNLRSDSHPPLYFLLLAVWMQLVGAGEAALRVPSIVFTLAAGAVLFFHGRRTGDPRLSVLFAALFLFNPITVGHIHTVRPYALAGLLAAASTVVYVRLGDSGASPGRAPWWVYVVVNALGTFTHYWFFFLLTGQAVGAVAVVRGRRALQIVLAIAVSAVPFAILWGPVFLGQLGGAPTSWMSTPGGFWLVRAPLQLMGGAIPFDYERAAIAFYGLVLAACVLRTEPRLGLVRWSEIKDLLLDRRVWLLAAVPATVMVMALVLSQIRPVFHVKYTIVTIPAFAMFLGLVIGKLADRRLAPVLALVFMMGSVSLRDRAMEFELGLDNRAITASLIAHHEDGDELLHVTLNYAPTLHYLRALAPERSFPQAVFPAEVANHPGWRDMQAVPGDSLVFRAEARETVRALGDRGGRVRLLATYDEDAFFTRILVDELEQRFTLRAVDHTQGWWVSEVRTYEPKPQPLATSPD